MPKQTSIFSEGATKAVVSVPGWVDDLGSTDERSAANPVDAWKSVPLLYRAVNLRCQSLSSVPFVVFKGDAEDEWPLADPLANIIYNAELALLLSGAAYLLKIYDGRTLTGVQWLNPTTVTWDYKDGENRYTQKIGDKTYGPWSDDMMIALREPSMTSDVGPGTAAAQVALMSARLRLNIDSFAAAYFEHGAQPTTIITTSGNPSVAEMERAQSYFRRSMTGLGNAWRTLFLRADIDIHTITPDLKTMELPELSQHIVLDIGAALGIPRSVLESDAANYATSQTDMRSFWEMTIRPRLPMFEAAINEQLFGDSTDGYTIQFTPENLEIFQADEAERSASLLQLVNAGVPLADSMAMLGYNPLENIPEAPDRVEVTTDEGTTPDAGVQEDAEQEMRAWQKYAHKNLKKKDRGGRSRQSTSRSASQQRSRADLRP